MMTTLYPYARRLVLALLAVSFASPSPGRAQVFDPEEAARAHRTSARPASSNETVSSHARPLALLRLDLGPALVSAHSRDAKLAYTAFALAISSGIGLPIGTRGSLTLDAGLLLPFGGRPEIEGQPIDRHFAIGTWLGPGLSYELASGWGVRTVPGFGILVLNDEDDLEGGALVPGFTWVNAVRYEWVFHRKRYRAYEHRAPGGFGSTKVEQPLTMRWSVGIELQLLWTQGQVRQGSEDQKTGAGTVLAPMVVLSLSRRSLTTELGGDG